MAPLTPHWPQPSHPDVQEVIVNAAEFTSKSLSRVTLPPFAVFAKLSFPPCTVAEQPTYATVQMAKDGHLNLNSDLLYINHSCDPSLMFDMSNMNLVVGPKGLKSGEELTFFYPSTEWHMAQPFDCLCGTPDCRGKISGAKDMTPAQLEGIWLNGHIIALREEQAQEQRNDTLAKEDATAKALRDAVCQAEKVLGAARLALDTYVTSQNYPGNGGQNAMAQNGILNEQGAGAVRRGPTSRELSGEMGGDTICI